jgi:phosphoenolpyruvate-protein kinase (PTS system EI component)
VLRLIKTVVEGAATHDCHVSVCGDAASDRIAAAIFVGLGIRSLSVRPRQAAEIKAVFRDLRETYLQQFAERALQSSDASQVRKLLSDHLESKEVPDPIESRQSRF